MTDLSVGSMVMEIEGDGPPVVMIHGLGGTSNSFQTLMAGLDGYRLLRPDLPGAGRSRLKPGVPGMKGLVSAVKDCLIAANVDRAHFVGHSMGALICQYLAADAPGLVSGMTLFGPLLEPPAAARQALKERAQTARNGGLTDIADSIFRGSVSEGQRVASAFVRESILRQDPNGYASHCEALSEAAAAAHQRITVPTLLIAGETDPVAPLAMVRQLQQDISLAQLEIVPQVAHWIMVEAPERSTQLLRAHLDTCHHK